MTGLLIKKLLPFALIAVLSAALLWSFQSRSHWKDEAEDAQAALVNMQADNLKQQEEINRYVKDLNSIGERHNARILRHGMSCAIAPATGVDGAGDAPRFGNPYPAISAYQAACERIAAKLEALQNVNRTDK